MSDKFEFIDVEYAAYQESGEQYVPSIVKMCIWMEVSHSGFYGWRDQDSRHREIFYAGFGWDLTS